MTQASPDRAAAIVCRGLTKRYGSILALDGLDLEVPTGCVFGLLGANGAGKTTTLKLLTGLTRPTRGRATVAGWPLPAGVGGVTRLVGYLDQDPRYYGWMTGQELLTFVGRLHGMNGRDLRARVAEVMEQVGLARAARRRIEAYSGGMRQRLGIGQALVNRPRVLFLDEPVSSLDPQGRHDILALIGDLRGSATVFMSTHILNDVERVCDRVAILDRGRVVIESAIDDLLRSHALPIYEIEVEAGSEREVERLRRTAEAHGLLDVRVAGAVVRGMARDRAEADRELLVAVAATGVPIVRFERLRPTLEDVFLQTVAGRQGSDAA